MNRLVALLAALLSAPLLHAQEAEPSKEAGEHGHDEDHVELSEEVVVTATRSGQRLQDQALRVEVLDADEIEEKLLMTPGDVAMLLNETSGLRVQVAAPSLGAANVRVQGLRGRYTQVLADGLPLYGQTGSVGLLQIPPMDLGQVEIIKGTASALYGASALGGVINLVSRRPPTEGSDRELLLNRTTRGGTDGVAWLAGRAGEHVGLSLLAGAHHQERHDVDDDTWADLAGYTRGVLRPRLLRQDDRGRSLFLTLGAMVEDRRGGTMPGGRVPGGGAFVESLDTRRYDAGLVARWPLGATRLLAVRASGMTQGHEHGFGDSVERDRHHTVLGEVTLTGTAGRHTFVAGLVAQHDAYRSDDVPRFDSTETVPGVLLQDDFAVSSRVTLSGSARLDHHPEAGTFLSPRGSVLVRAGAWTVRGSVGTGYHPPSPFTEETEAVGLRRVTMDDDLRAERAVTGSLDAGRALGPLELHATAFASRVRDPITVRRAPGALAVVNADGPVRTAGGELLGRVRWGNLVATTTYTLTSSTEVDESGGRREVALTPRHAFGVVAAWEQHGRGRVGVELYSTGRQRLDENPSREWSRAYLVLGVLAERRFGPARVFVNLENLTDARQTRWDPLVRPQRAADGRWTVDAWGPLEGRTINGGVRLSF